ncbi:MAG: sugar ABC transporter ATP-binding protein [Treponema sp.]|jgi:methyl-galactoside transport system ATP-binding protein|nr:sugar ABC transporter ATP-binding protein [Treponema sp.]
MENTVVLEMKHIKKTFPGVLALDGVSLSVRKGTVHALMGENGAGKSTLMKCAFGLYRPDGGDIYIEGKPVVLKNPRHAMDNGISMIHQELHPVRTRNVMENIWIGRLPCRKRAGIHWIDRKKMYRDTMDLFGELEIAISPHSRVSELSVAHCQLLEIVRAVSFNAKVIIMDEPTSSLTDVETELLFKIIRKLTRQNVTIVYISHKIEEILKISDEVSIMRDGKMAGNWPASELTENLIIKNMVGREMVNRFPARNHTPGEVVLEVRDFTSPNVHSFQNVSFSLRRGEIVGVGGLMGAQRTEVLEAVFGLRAIEKGTLILEGQELKIPSPAKAIKRGIALLTEDRRFSGIVPMLSITENTVMANQTARPAQYLKSLLFLNEKKRRAETEQCVQSLSVKTPSIKQQIQFLSGGNQQKVLLGRWLLTEPAVLILDEPTRGIDVGAKYEIYTLMEELVRQGKSIILISSEIPELLGMSDRIMVMCEGRLSGILERSEATDEKIIYYASADRSAAGGKENSPHA